MKTNPEISVIVPIYNSEDYLDICVESILQQSYKNFELILINDGSKDRSGAICDAFAVKDDRIVVIHKENAGVSAARNDGIDRARGKYIVFIDSDDYVDRAYLETLMTAMISGKTAFSMCNYVMEPILHGMEMDCTCEKSVFTYDVRELLEKRSIEYDHLLLYTVWAKLLIRDTIVKNRLYFDTDIDFCEDALFFMQYLECIPSDEKIVYFTNQYYHYVLCNPESLSQRYNARKVEFRIKTYNRMVGLYKQNNCSSSTLNALHEEYASSFMRIILCEFKNQKNGGSKEHVLEVLDQIMRSKLIDEICIREVNPIKKRFLFWLLRCRQKKMVYYLLSFRYWLY